MDDDWYEMNIIMSRVLGRQMQEGQRRRKENLQRGERLLTGRNVGAQGASSSGWLQSQLAKVPQGTKKISVDSAPPPSNLTAEEWGRVTTAYENGLEEERQLKAQKKDLPKAIGDLRQFLKFWDQLSPMAKGLLVGDDDLADMYEGRIVRFRIEDRADEALRYLTTPRGRPAAIANMRAAAVLADLWRARGGDTRPGRLYPDKTSGAAFGSDYSPNKFVDFIRIALRRLDPSLKTDGAAARRAKSAVDALHKAGRL
jgi:hypothetical protein